jgi:hypothetical protein
MPRTFQKKRFVLSINIHCAVNRPGTGMLTAQCRLAPPGLVAPLQQRGHRSPYGVPSRAKNSRSHCKHKYIGVRRSLLGCDVPFAYQGILRLSFRVGNPELSLSRHTLAAVREAIDSSRQPALGKKRQARTLPPGMS